MRFDFDPGLWPKLSTQSYSTTRRSPPQAHRKLGRSTANLVKKENSASQLVARSRCLLATLSVERRADANSKQNSIWVFSDSQLLLQTPPLSQVSEQRKSISVCLCI